MPDNPAGRLREIMSTAKTIQRRTTGARAWRQVLSDDGEKDLELHVVLERLARVVVLPAAIRRQVQAIPDVNHELYLRHIGVWERAFGERIRFDTQWDIFMTLFTEEHLYSLETCDELLSRMCPEPMLSAEFLVEIDGQLNDLRERVAHSDIRQDVRDLLLVGLDRMISALKHYRFSGVPPVIDALEASLGAAQLQRTVFERSKETELGREYWEKMGLIYSRVRDQWHPYQAIKGTVVDILALPSGP